MATNKEVTVMAYSAEQSQSEREFAAAVDPDERDLYAQEESSTTRRFIRYTDSEGKEQEFRLTYEEELFDALTESGAIDPENERVSVVEETETEMEYVTSTGEVGSSIKKAVGKALPDEIAGLNSGMWNYRWQDNAAETRVRLSSYGFSENRVMAHQGRRGNGEERFETEEEWPCYKLKVNINGDEEQVQKWSEAFVPQVIEVLSDFEGIGKVRITACTETVEKEGDCFDAL